MLPFTYGIAGRVGLDLVQPLATKSGHSVSFWDFTKYKHIFTLVSIAVSSVYLFIRY
jgi:Na+/H+ antiporter NhaD/arsenite permease-like protein